MKQKVILPKGAVIGIIGPACSGKTTLARQIVERDPERNAILVSADQVFRERFGISNREVVLNCKTEIAKLGGKAQMDRDYCKALQAKMLAGLQAPGRLIYEFAPNGPQEIASFILSSGLVRDKADCILIKLNIRLDLYERFVEERCKDGTGFPKEYLFFELPHQKEIMGQCYTNAYPWVVEYMISDPKEIDLRFSG